MAVHGDALRYEALPVHLVCRTDVGTGSVNLVVARRNRDGTICYSSFLVDFWKLGLKDSYGSFSLKTKKFDRTFEKMMERLERNGGGYFHPIEIEEAKWLVAQGLRIADAVGTPSSRHWVKIVGDIEGVRIEGSLYKCFRCERGELPDEVDRRILSVAKDEGRRRVAGTPEEQTLYFVCDNCRSESP
ncbi:MAG: hypothetical protein JRN16_03690 [Nitrososphaerota archaeon]|nr:hypothetical protein [Nitrososphaerota archaeon]